MGASISCGSLHLPTATLVVFQEDVGGLMKEFKEPVKVAQILRESPGFFLCDADSMRYDDYVSPLSADQELQLEHLYFMLPLNKLRHPLLASDMAALAVETSAAMERNRLCHNKLGKRCRKIITSLMMMEKEVAGVIKLQRVASSGQRKVNGVSLRRKLSTIHEEAFT